MGLSGSVNSRRRWLAEALRARLWPVPVAALTVALLLGAGLPVLDAQLDEYGWFSISGRLLGGGPEAGRTILEVVAAALITVTSLTFSLTVVTLQLASSQYSPRLLRTFSRDRFVQWTLGCFLGTFAFTLTVLRTIRGESEEDDGFVPEIAVSTAFLFTLVCVVLLVLFLAHLAREIRIETLLRNVHAEAETTLNRVYATDDSVLPGQFDLLSFGGEIIESQASGFLLGADQERLLKATQGADAVLRIDAEPGHTLIKGVPFAVAWGFDGRTLDQEDFEEFQDAIGNCVRVGFERTGAGDPSFGIRQLSDVAVRALSPGVNDPTTAVHALGHLSSLLCRLADRQLGPQVLRDENGHVRVILARPDFPALLELALAQPRLYGVKDPAVAARILSLLQEVAWADRSGSQQQALTAHLDIMRTSIDKEDYPKEQAEFCSRKIRDVEAALLKEWTH